MGVIFKNHTQQKNFQGEDRPLSVLSSSPELGHNPDGRFLLSSLSTHLLGLVVVR